MKNQLCFLFIMLNLVSGYSQTKEGNKTENVYFYVERQNFISDVLGYKAYFHIKSKDERFSHDTYYFKISYPNLDDHSLTELAKNVLLDTKSFIRPVKCFEEKTNAEVHIELSLMRKENKNIYVITDTIKNSDAKPENGVRKYLIWNAIYAGTEKDIIYTNMSNKILLDEKN